MDGRTLGVAIDLSPTSKYALSWALEHVARDGDHVYVLVVKKKDSGDAELFEKTGSPLIPMHDNDAGVFEQYGLNPDVEVFETIRQSREKKKIAVDGKIYWGDAREKILEAVGDLKLEVLVIGSRGLGTERKQSFIELMELGFSLARSRL